jgi:hypothetical protein
MPGQMMPGAPPQPEEDPTEAFMGARSVLNPNDMAMMVQSGELSPETTVEEYLGMLGLTPQSTLAELSAVGMKQMKNADPVGKMQTLAGRGQPSAGPAAPAPQPLAGGAPPIEDLLKESL